MTLREFVQLFVIHTTSDYDSPEEKLSAAIYYWHAINEATRTNRNEVAAYTDEQK